MIDPPEDPPLLPVPAAAFDVTFPIVIVGAGACGLIAALAASDSGVEALVLERDTTPCGSTAMSSGFIPAAGTRFQRDKGIEDTPDLLLSDLLAKNGGRTDQDLAATVCRAAGPALEWLANVHGVPFEVLDSFLYPGHTRLRMHATPQHTGADLHAYLMTAASRAGIDIVTGARVVSLYQAADDTIAGVRIARPDGSREDIGCAALVLACNGYGGDAALVREHIPEIADAVYFGHAGNTGDALRWGEALGAAVADLGSYQGHGSVARGHNILITWALMAEGAILVNADGARFSNEHDGYSEQAVRVLAQPNRVAWDIYDQRLHRLGMEFEDYRDAVNIGAVIHADTMGALAEKTGLPGGDLVRTLDACATYAAGTGSDPLGRDFTTKPALAPPYCAIKVTAALFHTQGGLSIDSNGRVLRPNGTAFPNLFAGGGAARGLSGPDAAGYLSGNGLLTAVNLGRICGQSAAALAED